MKKCLLCDEESDALTTLPIRYVKKVLLEIEICEFCRHTLLAELMKQFLLENWMPNMEEK